MLSALVALAILLPSCSAGNSQNENDEDLTYIVDLLGSVGDIDQDVIESVLEKKILPAGKKVTIYGREISTEEVIKLFKQVSKVNWKSIRPLLEKHELSKNKHLHIDEKKILMPKIIQLAERFSKANWKSFTASFGNYLLLKYVLVFCLINAVIS